MGKPYSMDLRERVVAAIKSGGMSCNRAAKQFRLGSTVVNWVGLLRETGSVAPGKMGGHKPKKIAAEHGFWLLQRIKVGDFTLRGLVAELAERGLKVDYRSHAEKLNLKKSLMAGERTPTWRGGARKTTTFCRREFPDLRRSGALCQRCAEDDHYYLCLGMSNDGS